jgi:hypothetical protein
MKICPVEAELFHADRRMNRDDKANSRCSQFCKCTYRTLGNTEITCSVTFQLTYEVYNMTEKYARMVITCVISQCSAVALNACLLCAYTLYLKQMGTTDGGTVAKVLHYKSEGHWFDSRWCHWNFSLTKSF